MDKRRSTANDAIDLLETVHGVTSVHLRGSLSASGGDRYSDIDIGCSCPETDAHTATRRVIDAMTSAFDLEFFDWASSLLPDTPVISFYVRDLPIFWNIDVQIEVAPEKRNVTREMVHNDPIAHLLKLWAITLKHLIRRDSRAAGEVRKVWTRTVGAQKAPDDAYLSLRIALEKIASSGGFERFVARCYAALDGP